MSGVPANSQEAAPALPSASPSDAPADDQALSPAEQAYFESGGETTDGLVEKTEPALLEGGVAEYDQQGNLIKGGWVNHAAFNQERVRRKAVEKQLGELSERFTRGDERLRLLTEALTPPVEQQQEQAPDPDKDIFAYTRYLEKQMVDLRSGLERQLGEVKQRYMADQEESSLANAYVGDAQRFIAQQPDFADAYRHLLNARGTQLAMMGHPPEQIPQMLVSEERSLARRALINKQSPARMIYEFARSYGYVPSDFNGALADAGALAEGGKRAPPASGAAANAQLQNIAAAQAAGKSLSSTGGGESTVLSTERLAALPQHEFDALYERAKAKGPAAVRALIGG